MKTVIFGLLLMTSSAFAGDLGLVCFKDGDVGNYIKDQTTIEKNNVSVSFSESRKSYVILVERKTFFKNYTYEIITIDNIDQSFKKKHVRLKNYDDVVDVDKNIQCQVRD